jgi:hypothetical protein
MSASTNAHWQAYKRVLRYVKETISTTQLQIFTDPDILVVLQPIWERIW